MVTVFAVIYGIIIVSLVIALLPVKVKRSIGKFAVAAVAVSVIAVLFGGVLYGALAEDLFDEVEVEEFVAIKPLHFNGEALLLISFEYHGDILSWYEEGEFYPGRTYKLIVFNGIEVIDAEPVQEGGEPCFPH